MNHYVYYIADPETRHFYYGSRTCECDPVEDNYMGSMSKWDPQDKDVLLKNILSIHSTREEANKAERKLINRDIKKHFNENYHIPVKGFRTYGMKHKKETIEKMKKTHKGKVISEEAKRKMSLAKQGENHWIYGTKRPKEHCENISKGRKGIEFSEEHKENIRKSKTGENHPFYGKSRPKETIRKITESNRKYPILQFDKEGNFIREWEAQSVASQETGIARRAINNCLNGRCKSSGGYIWKFKYKGKEV